MADGTQGRCWPQVEARFNQPDWRIDDVRFAFLINAEPGPLPGYGIVEVDPNALLHPQVPQPDGRRMHELLTRHDRRDPGCVVRLSDMTGELDLHGHHWFCIGVDWPLITDAIGHLAADRRIPALVH